MAEASSSPESRRQRTWRDAAEQEAQRGNEVAAGFFAFLALPNERERSGHSCCEHALGFTREDRRGFRCGICHTVIRWVDA